MAAAATVAGLAVAATAAWWTQVAPGARLAPMAAVAAALAAGWLTPRMALAALAAWIPAALLLAAVPAAALAPGDGRALVGQIGSGVAGLVAPGGRPAGDPWPLVAVMIGSGALWIAGAALAAGAPASSRRRVVAFCLLAVPWLAAVGLGAGDRAGWLGAIVLVAGLLWFACSRAALAIGLVAALVCVTVAQAVGPRTRWLELAGQPAAEPPFDTLDTQPTYGPPQDTRTGAAMLDIATPEPGLWRMQTLDDFDGTHWQVSATPLPELPQPAARRERLTVRVLGLRNDLVVAPGRIRRLEARGKLTQAGGEAWRVTSGLPAGSTYRLSSEVVRASPEQLARDRAPIDPRTSAYTRLAATPGRRTELEQLGRVLLGSLGVKLSAPRVQTIDPDVVALARRLAAGAHTEWELVTRVERFLLDGRRFHYTTHVPGAGPQPLVDFLVRTHAGYCQQFAGAAALLLRLAGVPARVVAGFATGDRTAAGRYTVRDLDAHDWIEVYFAGYGWVPFNPTPAAARAQVAAGIDPLTPSRRAAAGGGPPAMSVWLFIFAAVVAAAGLRRRRAGRGRDRLPELLERIARRTGARLGPSTTLSELGAVLARVGPCTAALAAEAERARFAPDPPGPARHARVRLARALARDVGAVRAFLVHLPALKRPPERSVAATIQEQDYEQR